jgi:hypothetical protein
VDNIKTYLKEVGWQGVEWINFVHNREQGWVLVKAAVKFGFCKM